MNAELFKKFPNRKIEINRTKNPIRMSLFLSFFNGIDFEISRDHLGSSNGWTRTFNNEHKIIITGGIADGVEWLDNIQYGTKLANSFNNYVNPFFLFDLFNEEGKEFFIDYYKDEINELIEDSIRGIKYSEKEIEGYRKNIIELEELKTKKQ